MDDDRLGGRRAVAILESLIKIQRNIGQTRKALAAPQPDMS